MNTSIYRSVLELGLRPSFISSQRLFTPSRPSCMNAFQWWHIVILTAGTMNMNGANMSVGSMNGANMNDMSTSGMTDMMGVNTAIIAIDGVTVRDAVATRILSIPTLRIFPGGVRFPM